MTEQPTAHPRPLAPAPAAPRRAERQEARRRRILDATVSLARRGGFEAVQMREVAETSGVALGTLYRHFPSKIHLLVATMHDRLEHLHRSLHRHPPQEPEPSARVAGTLLRAFRALQREPRLTEAMVRAFTFADRSAGAEVDAVSRLTTAIILDALGTAGDAGTPGTERLPAVRVIEHTWHSALTGWLSGRASGEQVRGDIEMACRLIDITAQDGARR
ncbi:TetR family transcriptional regulator [Streptomyces carminius]|uniref:TetR family transcriptional regulator n=1 Tax=Streptomyces carminius TaxID=2665496 RepID=A0A2M8LR58_9ACTN|nr:TetR family transcriptional regulator [Streptomyces carminius]PJE94441.1 TetR family transcriptional regulator [Streptomyces carminius]